MISALILDVAPVQTIDILVDYDEIIFFYWAILIFFVNNFVFTFTSTFTNSWYKFNIFYYWLVGIISNDDESGKYLFFYFLYIFSTPINISIIMWHNVQNTAIALPSRQAPITFMEWN